MKKYLQRFWNLSSTLKDSSEKQLTVTLKEEQVYICELTLPIMPAKEIKEAVGWELPYHIPLIEGNFYYDYTQLGKNDGMQQIKAVAVAKEVVEQLGEAAKEKDLLLVAVNVEGNERINLLPDAKARLRYPRNKLYRLGTVAALSLGILLCLGSYVYKTIQVQKLHTFQERLQAMAYWEKRFEEQQAVSERISLLEKALSKFERERIVWSKLLLILGECVPKECWLTQVKQREENNFIELQGKAVNVQQVQGLIENLKATLKFENIKLSETVEARDELLGFKILLQRKGMKQ